LTKRTDTAKGAKDDLEVINRDARYYYCPVCNVPLVITETKRPHSLKCDNCAKHKKETWIYLPTAKGGKTRA